MDYLSSDVVALYLASYGSCCSNGHAKTKVLHEAKKSHDSITVNNFII
jgi:hypothetical protein